MSRSIILGCVALTLACGRSDEAPPRDTTPVAPPRPTPAQGAGVTAGAAPTAASDSVRTVTAPDSDDVVIRPPATLADGDTIPWNRFPRIFADTCEGESCSTRFQAVACAPARLRTAAADAAPLGPSIAKGDSAEVLQTDLHLTAPGVVVMRRNYVIGEIDVEEGAPRPVTDTLRLSAGDTIYLLRYYELGSWQAAVRGKTYGLSDGFWFGQHLLGMLGSSARDSSTAVARSYPKVATWWKVKTKNGEVGWWNFDMASYKTGLKPEGKYWEFGCGG